MITIAAVLIVGGIGAWLFYDQSNSGEDETVPVDPKIYEKNLVLTVDGKRVDVNWEDNSSVNAIKVLAKDTLAIQMHRYGGFEQTGSMESPIVSDDSWIEVGYGDIVLYNAKQICLYYGSNDYDFTRLGRMTGISVSEITEMLDRPNVTAVLTLE